MELFLPHSTTCGLFFQKLFARFLIAQRLYRFSFQGCLFIFGGELGYGSCGETPLWVYSLARQTWEKPVIESEVVTPSGRRGHTAVVWHGGMHVYGGYVDLKGSSSELWTLDFGEIVISLLH